MKDTWKMRCFNAHRGLCQSEEGECTWHHVTVLIKSHEAMEQEEMKVETKEGKEKGCFLRLISWLRLEDKLN